MKFKTDSTKDFNDDLNIIIEALENDEKISFSKFCDGEWAIMTGTPMPEVQHGEWTFDPDNEYDAMLRNALVSAFQYNNPRYYIGISGPAVWGAPTFLSMLHNSQQPSERITWADIFVNCNYKTYVDRMVPLYSRKPVVLFCNEDADISAVPFDVVKKFTVQDRAWRSGLGLIEEAKRYVIDNDVKDHYFLFCCGPIGNVLCAALTDLEEDNTYLDVGSTLNPYLKLDKYFRDYYNEDSIFAKHKGVWLHAG